MKHSSLSKVGIAATLGLAGLMGSATGSFAQTRVVDGMFGPRTFGQPTLAPVRVIATGAPVGLDGQPLGFERARGTLVPSTGQGWSFGSPSPTAIAPWPAAPLSNPAFPVYGGGNGSAAIGMGGGGGLFPLPPNFPPPGQTTQPGTGTSTQTPGTTPNAGPQGQPANVSAQNPSATPGQNPGANPAVAPGQTAPGGAAPGGASPATTATDFAPLIPPAWKIEYPPVVTPGVAVASARLTSRLQNAKEIQKQSPISVSLDQDIAVIRGRVATEHDRDLAGAMLRLEPGVGGIRNELTVAAPAAP